MCVSCCSQAFWAHEYNTPHTFRPADYLADLRDARASCEAHVPLGLRAALACEAQTMRATLSDIRWRAGVEGRSAPPVTRSATAVPHQVSLQGDYAAVLCLALASRVEPPLGKTTRCFWHLGELA